MRVSDKTGAGCGAGAGDAEKFTDCLARDLCARVQQPGDDGSIEIRDETFKYRRAVHHGNIRDENVVLYCDRPALERTRMTALQVGPDVPGAQGIFLCSGRTVTPVRIPNFRQVISQLVHELIGVAEQGQLFQHAVRVRVVHGQSQGSGNGFQFIPVRHYKSHWLNPNHFDRTYQELSYDSRQRRISAASAEIPGVPLHSGEQSWPAHG